jgi:hypothetical protein
MGFWSMDDETVTDRHGRPRLLTSKERRQLVQHLHDLMLPHEEIIFAYEINISVMSIWPCTLMKTGITAGASVTMKASWPSS